MAHATKPEQMAAGAGGARTVGELLQDKNPRSAGCLNTMEKFRGMKFVNGTLVQWPTMFSEMEMRGKVAKFSIENGRVQIRAEGTDNYFYCDMELLTVVEKNDVFYLVGSSCPNPCAIAPEGVEIPKGPIMKLLTGMDEEGIEDSKRLLREGMGACRGGAPKAQEDGKPTASELADARLVLKGIKE